MIDAPSVLFFTCYIFPLGTPLWRSTPRKLFPTKPILILKFGYGWGKKTVGGFCLSEDGGRLESDEGNERKSRKLNIFRYRVLDRSKNQETYEICEWFQWEKVWEGKYIQLRTEIRSEWEESRRTTEIFLEEHFAQIYARL